MASESPINYLRHFKIIGIFKKAIFLYYYKLKTIRQEMRLYNSCQKSQIDF